MKSQENLFKTYFSTIRAPEVSGIVFAICHYNRPDCFIKALSSVLSEIREGDCLLLIENGSPAPVKEKIFNDLVAQWNYVPSGIGLGIFSAQKNNGGGPAYRWLLNFLISDSLPNASHLLLLADDDMLVKGWREQVDQFLTPENWIAWGYNYFNWDLRSIEHGRESYSSTISTLSGSEVHCQWLKYISTHIPVHSRQEHPSACAIPLQALKSASSYLATLIPLPYSDVGLALVVFYAKSYVYFDKPIGLIGRGRHYGMGDADLMGLTHPTRGKVWGLPSHPKYAAVTYCECLYLINRLDLVTPVVERYIRLHFRHRYGSILFFPFGIIFELFKLGRKLTVKRKVFQMMEDSLFLVALGFCWILPFVAARIFLFAFGCCPSLITFQSLNRERILFLNSLAC